MERARIPCPGGRWPRRALLAVVLGGLAGCGFRPLYGTDASGSGVGADLAGIYVELMPERSGQLLRQALQRRLDGTGQGVARRYAISVSYSVAGEGIAIQQDNTTTRMRLIGNAQWALRDLTPDRAVVTAGTARAVDGLNILAQQYFAADLETDTVNVRLAEAMATQIVQQLATYLRRTRDKQAAT